jgi:hypothetical protein
MHIFARSAVSCATDRRPAQTCSCSNLAIIPLG